MADGQRVGVDEAFTVGGEKLMFPGDRSHGASGWNIYNCRCSVKRLSKATGVSGKHTTSGSNALRKNKRKP